MDLIKDLFKGDKVIWIIFLFLCLISIVEVLVPPAHLPTKVGIIGGLSPSTVSS